MVFAAAAAAPFEPLDPPIIPYQRPSASKSPSTSIMPLPALPPPAFTSFPVFRPPFTLSNTLSNLHPIPSRVPPRHPPSSIHFSLPRPQIAWLSGNPSHDSHILRIAHLSSPYIIHTLASPSAVLTLARLTSAPVVHVHASHPSATPSLPRFNAAHIHLCIHNSSSPSLAAPLAVPALASAATVPLLVETRDDTVIRFAKGDDDRLLEERVLDTRTLWQRLIAWLMRVYLPQGFPHTTTPDYISFTKYRTLQNLASAIMSVISTEALLFGLGLGKKVAAGAAATSWVLKDGASYIAKIWYGSVFGSRFDDDPKSWRIAADIVEDIGGAIEILTPLFPMAYFLPLASLAVCLRGCSLMTGTATRHVVYRSLAASGMQNTGDIATKGESQGVTMKMLGLGTGILVSSTIGQNYYALLAAYSALAAVHIVANWRSVQCVQFAFFNKQRASILIDSHLKGEPLPSPYDVSHAERIILPPWIGFQPSVKIGTKVADAVTSSKQLEDAVRMFKGERFLIFALAKGSKVRVLMSERATPKDALRAYYTVKRYLRSGSRSPDALARSLRFMKRNIGHFERNAVQAGWDNTHMLLTDGQTRVSW